MYCRVPGRGQSTEGGCESEHERELDRERERDSKRLVSELMELMEGWGRCWAGIPPGNAF